MAFCHANRQPPADRPHQSACCSRVPRYEHIEAARTQLRWPGTATGVVFEIRDLKHATPATTSRAGILYISTDEGSQWRSLIKSWIGKNAPEKGFSEELTAKLKEYFEVCVDPRYREALFAFDPRTGELVAAGQGVSPWGKLCDALCYMFLRRGPRR